MKLKKALIASIAGLITLLTSSMTAAADNNEVILKDTINPIAESFNLKLMSGKEITLSDYQNQSVLLLFWATWCTPCRKLLPGIERLHQKYSDQGLKVIGITQRDGGDPAAYMKKHGYTFAIAFDAEELREDYHAAGTPAIAIFSKNSRWHAHLRTSDPNSLELENAVRTSLNLEPLVANEP